MFCKFFDIITMKRINTTLIFNTSYLLLLLINVGIGFPMERPERNAMNKLIPNETSYPNGTVIGRYSYMDREGNPVQVKYYADDSSYGVELNSVKMFVSKKDKDKAETEKAKKEPLDYIEGYKYPAETAGKRYELKNIDEPESTNKIDTAHYKSQYRNSEYDIYKPNDVAANIKCGSNANEKVYLYNFEKEPRKVFRSVPDIAEEESQFCQLY